MEHRLAAIFSADAAGYTRLLADDQPATIRALGDARELFVRGIAHHRGRVIDTAGDNVLAEFPSALDAVRCGVELQRSLSERAAALPESRRLLFRIGLHLGDIAAEADRIYGDGVNVAARLQTLAEPGGICVSAAIHDNVAGRLDLPFANVSADADQEFFADGMSEDLITELARIPELFVIGRGTSFAYKGKPVAARALGRELGVRHIVEGSVRRAGARVRITARLTEAQSGREVWSERWDRELGDVFALQDEVVGGIVAELRRALGASLAHSPRERAVTPEVWALFVQGRSQTDLTTPDGIFAGHGLLERCVALDPDFAPAWAELARAEYHLWLYGLVDDATLEQGFVHARRALELDPEHPEAHLVLGLLHAMRGEAEAALAAERRSVELAPGRAELRLGLAVVLNFAERAEEAIPILKSLPRVDPALRYNHAFQLAICYRRLGRPDEAIAKHHECLAAHPEFIGAHMNLAAIYASLGEMNQAHAALAEVLRLRPDFSIARIPRLPSGREWLAENLRKAGLRE